MKYEMIDPETVQLRLQAERPAWRYADGAIHRRIETAGWKAGLMLVNAIGFLAEAAWHHPELTLGYAAVEIRLTTHEAGGITTRDLDLAAAIDALVATATAGGEGTPAVAAIIRRG